MKVIIFFALLVAALAAPQGSPKDVLILRQEQDVNADGSYKYNFETSNGISVEEQGFLKNAGQEDKEVQVVQGSNKYTAPTGEVVETSYIADENGYQVQGAHLPTPPPIPEAILRALQWILDHPEKEEKLSKF